MNISSFLKNINKRAYLPSYQKVNILAYSKNILSIDFMVQDNISAANALLLTVFKKKIPLSQEAFEYLFRHIDVDKFMKECEESALLLLLKYKSKYTNSIKDTQIIQFIEKENLTKWSTKVASILEIVFKKQKQLKFSNEVVNLLIEKSMYINSNSLFSLALAHRVGLTKEKWTKIIEKLTPAASGHDDALIRFFKYHNCKTALGENNFKLLLAKSNLKHIGKDGQTALSTLLDYNFNISEADFDFIASQSDLAWREENGGSLMRLASAFSHKPIIWHIINYLENRSEECRQEKLNFKEIIKNKVLSDYDVEQLIMQDKIDLTIGFQHTNILQMYQIYRKTESIVILDKFLKYIDLNTSKDNRPGLIELIRNALISNNMLLHILNNSNVDYNQKDSNGANILIKYLTVNSRQELCPEVLQKLIINSNLEVHTDKGDTALKCALRCHYISYDTIDFLIDNADLSQTYQNDNLLSLLLIGPELINNLNALSIDKIIDNLVSVTPEERRLFLASNASKEQKRKIKYFTFFKLLKFVTSKRKKIYVQSYAKPVQDYREIGAFSYKTIFDKINSQLDFLSKMSVSVEDERKTFNEIISLSIKEYYLKQVNNQYENNQLGGIIELLQNQIEDKIANEIDFSNKETKKVKKYLELKK